MKTITLQSSDTPIQVIGRGNKVVDTYNDLLNKLKKSNSGICHLSDKDESNLLLNILKLMDGEKFVYGSFECGAHEGFSYSLKLEQ